MVVGTGGDAYRVIYRIAFGLCPSGALIMQVGRIGAGVFPPGISWQAGAASLRQRHRIDVWGGRLQR